MGKPRTHGVAAMLVIAAVAGTAEAGGLTQRIQARQGALQAQRQAAQAAAAARLAARQAAAQQQAAMQALTGNPYTAWSASSLSTGAGSW